jgi:hypothetical protein
LVIRHGTYVPVRDGGGGRNGFNFGSLNLPSQTSPALIVAHGTGVWYTFALP